MRFLRTRSAVAVTAAISGVALAGCAGSGSKSGGTPGSEGFTPPDVPMQKAVGKGEGWKCTACACAPGFAEDAFGGVGIGQCVECKHGIETAVIEG